MTMFQVDWYVCNFTKLAKFWLAVLVLLLGVWPVAARARESFLSAGATDPANRSIGFARAHWVSSIGKMVPVLGNGPATGDEKSVRAFDPVSDTWEYLWRNGQGGLQNRDNYASLYVTQLDEIWVWGGSYLETVPGALRSGRFSIAQRKWITSATSDSGAFTDVVENFGGFLIDNGTAWSADANMGIIFGGSDQGNPSNRYWIIEPNPGGSKSYRMAEVVGGTRPAARDQCMNCIVAVGRDFYLFGGHTANDANGRWITPPELWKFSSTSRTWTRLADGPGGGYQSTLTYDSDRNALLAWVYDKIYVFDLAAQVWSDQTPPELPCIFNQIGVYSPTARIHLFEGGNLCSSGDSPGVTVYGISLAGTRLPDPPPIPNFSAILPPSVPISDPVSNSPAPAPSPDPGLVIISPPSPVVTNPNPSPPGGDSQARSDGRVPRISPGQGLIIVPPPTIPLPPTTPPSVTVPSTLTAIDLGATGEDRVGPNNQTSSNGKPDFHISVSGLRAEPSKVIITSDTGGIWQSPFNGTNWIIATQYDAAGNGNFWFEQFGSNKLHVKVNYSDGTADEADAVRQVVSGPPASPSPPTSPIVTPPTPPAPTPPISGSAGSNSQLQPSDIPLRTWIARRYGPPDTPAGGFDGGGGVGSKHLRLAQNPLNGRMYFMGGDYSVHPDRGNSWYGLWSYDVLADKWFLEYPWCGSPGEIMPSGRDEVGWVWDSKRKVFWMLPGFMQQPSWRCPDNSANEEIAILTFDPATNKYSNPNAAPEPIPGQKPKNAIYDLLTDSIYRSGEDGRGFIWTIYHIASNTWDVYQTPFATNGEYTNNTSLAFEYIAADLGRRKIYGIDPVYYRLFEFDMDQHTLSIKAAIPEPNQARIAASRQLQWTLRDFTMPVFDTVNNVLLFPYVDALALDGGPYGSRPQLLIYHPDTDRWETDSMYQPDGMTVRGNSFAFDAVNNLLISFGGLAPGGDSDPTATHFFIYRYGNGKGN